MFFVLDCGSANKLLSTAAKSFFTLDYRHITIGDNYELRLNHITNRETYQMLWTMHMGKSHSLWTKAAILYSQHQQTQTFVSTSVTVYTMEYAYSLVVLRIFVIGCLMMERCIHFSKIIMWFNCARLAEQRFSSKRKTASLDWRHFSFWECINPASELSQWLWRLSHVTQWYSKCR